LAPEALTGSSPSRADDVYSLGAILYEMLIGERLPAAATTGDFDAMIDGAELPNEGTPLPGPVAALLKKSLAPRDQRIADAVTWHKTLSKLMIDGHFSPTTFNLAFFMHNLFRDEIERESQEMQAEKKLELPKRQAGAGGRTRGGGRRGERRRTEHRRSARGNPFRHPLGHTLPGRSGVVQEGDVDRHRRPGRPPAGRRRLFPLRGARPERRPRGTTTPTATPVPVEPPAPGTTPAMDPAAKAAAEAQLQAQIQQMFEARSKEMEAKFKTQYDDRIKLLQKQLEDTRKGGLRRRPGRGRCRRNPPSPAPWRVASHPRWCRHRCRKKPAVAAPTPAPVQEKPIVPVAGPGEARRSRAGPGRPAGAGPGGRPGAARPRREGAEAHGEARSALSARRPAT